LPRARHESFKEINGIHRSLSSLAGSDRTSAGHGFIKLSVLSKSALWSVFTAMFSTMCHTFLLLV
jgi:hypothetical protein